MDGKARKKCEFIVRQFMSVEDPDPELRARFHAWLLDGRLCREKESVLWELFDEMVPGYFGLPDVDSQQSGEPVSPQLERIGSP